MSLLRKLNIYSRVNHVIIANFVIELKSDLFFCGEGTVHPSGAPELTLGLLVVFVLLNLKFSG
jgi:hypothetical protein